MQPRLFLWRESIKLKLTDVGRRDAVEAEPGLDRVEQKAHALGNIHFPGISRNGHHPWLATTR